MIAQTMTIANQVALRAWEMGMCFWRGTGWNPLPTEHCIYIIPSPTHGPAQPGRCARVSVHVSAARASAMPTGPSTSTSTAETAAATPE